MKLKHYFLVLTLLVAVLATVALFAAFHLGGESFLTNTQHPAPSARQHPYLFYVTEAVVVLLLVYLGYFYRKTIRPYDTLIGGVELVRDLDLTTRLAPSGQHETDVIVRMFNDLLARLRSEHLRLEEQYTFLNLLIEASPMGVIQCDLDGNITTMNPAARQMLSESMRQALQSLPLGEVTTVHVPGEPQLFRISHLSFPDRGYQHPFFLIESLTSEIRLAEKAAYERVIRMIAHEVNNSVAGIISLTPGSPTPKAPPSAPEGATVDSSQNGKTIEAPSGAVGGAFGGGAFERLSALSAFVTRFADVVKTPKPQLQLCDLSEEVEACRPFLENLCTSGGVHIDFRLTDEAIPVRLDSVLFQQVLINIVKNAVESIRPTPTLPEREGVVTIRPTPTLPEREGVVTIEVVKHSSPLPHREGQGGGSAGAGSAGGSLVVTDNGRGISPDVAQHLFTPFFSTKPQGQGLGLLLIRDILTAHHCTFSLLTDPTDHLTRFTIQF